MFNFFRQKNFSGSDERAYAQLYRQYAKDLFSYGMGFTASREDCMDAIHDVFYKLYFTKDLSSVRNIKAYLLSSLRNRLLDIARNKKKTNPIETIKLSFQTEVTVLDSLISEEESKLMFCKVEKLLHSLSEHQREIVYLRYMQELEYEEIGQILNIHPESVRKQVYRALSTLRRLVAL
jgi:RNA polymerase sigma factor (sigma-70 family)